MIISGIIKGGIQKGHLIQLEQKEAQLFMEVFEEYCKANKKKVLAKKVLKQFETDLECF